MNANALPSLATISVRDALDSLAVGERLSGADALVAGPAIAADGQDAGDWNGWRKSASIVVGRRVFVATYRRAEQDWVVERVAATARNLMAAR